MANDQLDYEAIRTRAEKRANKRKEFLLHLAVYILVNLGLWLVFVLIAAATTPLALIPPLLSTLGWGVGVGIHALVNYFDTTGMDSMRDREYQRELEREMRRRGIDDPAMLDKPKRDQTVRLSDDGELVYEDDEQPNRRSSRNR
jgi:uncharacterized membrane protein (DUF485 family)